MNDMKKTKTTYRTHRLLDSVGVDGVAEDDVFVSRSAHQHGARPVHAGIAPVVQSHLTALGGVREGGKEIGVMNLLGYWCCEVCVMM